MASVLLQGKPCTKKACLKENPYEKAFFSTMLALKKALKGKKQEGAIFKMILLKGVDIPKIRES